MRICEKDTAKHLIPYSAVLNDLGNAYLQKGIFDKAELFFVKALTIKKNIYGAKHLNYATTLNAYAVLSADMGNYDKADTLYKEVIEIRKTVLGEIHPLYANSLIDLGTLYYELGSYPEAELLFLQAKDIYQKAKMETTFNYGVLLNNLAVLYSITENYEKAETSYLESLKIAKTIFGVNHSDYATSAINLATFYEKFGKYELVEPLYIEGIEIFKNLYGEDHPDYANSLSLLASFYQKKGDYKQAESLFIKTLQITKTIFGENSTDYADALNNLGKFYSHIGNYEKAEPLLIKSITIFKTILGKDNPNYASYSSVLGDFYEKKGEYVKAEPYYLEALKINKKTYGEKSVKYAITLNNLAGFYLKIGNYEKAETICLEIPDILKLILGESHQYYASSLNNLAVVYTALGKYELAEPLYLRSLNIIKAVLGETHPEYARLLRNLAKLYANTKEFAKSELLLWEALKIQTDTTNLTNLEYLTTKDILAFLYTLMGSYAKAESLYLETLELRENILGKTHPDYTVSVSNLAILYQKMGDYDKASLYFKQANENISTEIAQNFSFMSELEKEKFIKKIDLNFKNFHSFTLNYQKQNPEFVGLNYNNELEHKGIILNSGIALRLSIINSGDSALLSVYLKQAQIKKNLSALYAKNATKEQTEPLENEAEVLEKEVNRKAQNLPEYLAQQNVQKANWQTIQKALKPDEIAIEYTTFQYKDKDRWTDSIYTCALILRKDYKYPKMVYMFEEKELIKTLQNSNNQNNSPNDLYAARGIIKLVINSQPLNEKLYKLIWQPIESELNGIKHLYLAPSGLLHNVSFAALSIGDSLYLSDKYSINTVSSTAAILNKQKLNAPENIVLYGGINYDLDTLVMANNSKLYEVQHNVLAARAVSELESVDNWNYLNGTKSEIDIIAQFFSKKKKKTTVFSNQLANEESFKALSGKKTEVIHLATHGFYFEKQSQTAEELNKQELLQNQNIFKTSENPLLRSGLLFAGANRAWNKKSIPENVEDGILTSYEVSQMNLSNVKLVTLSACQTGLGDVYIGEGVIGLQRAFKMAGVQNLIVSLWSIPDKETVEFMELFYKNWLKTNDIQNAFRKAQSTMRKKYPPYYWAAFKLVN